MKSIKSSLDNNIAKETKINMTKNKLSQTTILIILAIVIIAGIIIYFIFRQELIFSNVPKQFQPVYDHYLSCIESETKLGSLILGEQAGYIEAPEFSPGSVYMPFSNQLDFLGTGIPYWYYISGNGVVKEQVPSKEKMESQLNEFLKERILDCEFSNFAQQGYRIEIERKADVKTEIKKNFIEVNVAQNLNFYFGDDSWQTINHYKKVSSNLGKFYELAVKVYNSFKETKALEEYGVDILRLYAPVDGVDIGCVPKIWSIGGVRENLTRALEANIGFIKIKGDYYRLKNEDNKYFVHDIGENVDSNVNFLYLREWPMKMEVWPSEDGLLKAEPIGMQEGLGMLGFCYVPYHFVYDFAYPILIQFYYNDEMFQFPVIVYINKNKPKISLEGESLPDIVPELCKRKNTELTIRSYNKNLEPLEADISFKCLETKCDIGKTILKDGESVLIDKFPQCVNGYVIASADGYETGKYLVSSVESQEISVVLDKKYKLELEIKKEDRSLSNGEYSVITFKKDSTKTFSYPEQNQIELSEGQYEIKVYIYSNSDISLEGTTSQKCIKVPKSGIFGVFGLTEEKCFDLEIPGQKAEYGISGGGTQNYYITDSELETSEKIIIDAKDFGTPNKAEELYANFNKIDVSRMEVKFE